MSLLRNIVLVLSFLSLVACGFHPLYSRNGEQSEAIRNKLLAITVDVESKELRPAQELKNDLQDLLNPASLSAEKEYRLKIKLSKEQTALIIEQDRRITRYNLLYNASYQLVKTATAQVVNTGHSKMVGSYDALGSEYAVYTAESDTSSRVLRELAKDIELKIGGAFANLERH